MIQITNLEKTFLIGKEVKTVLKDLDITIQDGEFAVVMGDSGCGKSTFLNCVSGLEKFDNGEIKVDNICMNIKNQKAMEQLRTSKFGYIFQDNYMIDNLTIIENVAMPRYQFDKDAFTYARALLKKLNIEEIADKYPSHVSGGEKQRAAIARALINEPMILFADEPTASLNKDAANSIMHIFKQMNDEGQTILMVTHSEQIAAYGSRLLTIENHKFEKDIPLDNDYESNLSMIMQLSGE